MRKTLLLFLTTLCWLNVCGANVPHRRIFLWDITQSTKGWTTGAATDTIADTNHPKYIYDDIAEYITKQVNIIADETTEIIICPYKDKVLTGHIIRGFATPSGKARIITALNTPIADLSNIGTNIVGAIQYAKEYLIKADKYNMLYILTDGNHNMNGANSKRIFENEIRTWKGFAEQNNARAIYVLTGDATVDSVQLGQSGILVIPPKGLVPVPPMMVTMIPQDIQMTVNDFEMSKSIALTLPFQMDKLDSTIAPKFQVVIQDSQNLFKVKTFQVVLDGNRIILPLEITTDYTTLRMNLPVDCATIVPIQLTLLNKEELAQADVIITMAKSMVELSIINNPISKVTFRVK